MKAKKSKSCDAPCQFEPLLPEARTMEPLLERASDLTRAPRGVASVVVPAARHGVHRPNQLPRHGHQRDAWWIASTIRTTSPESAQMSSVGAIIANATSTWGRARRDKESHSGSWLAPGVCHASKTAVSSS